MSKLREQACELLATAGIEAWPDQFDFVSGFWKSQDVYRWQLLLPDVTISAWQTLGDFVAIGRRWGVAFNAQRNEVYAREPVRAGGRVACEVCQRPLRDHDAPFDFAPTVAEDCEGNLWKL